jgi:hypothetical protein
MKRFPTPGIGHELPSSVENCVSWINLFCVIKLAGIPNSLIASVIWNQSMLKVLA